MSALDPQSLPRHLDRLYRAAWALCGSPHEAEDLVQETFARVLARPRTLRGQNELAYLMTVLHNTFLTERRTASRRPRVSAATIEELEPVDPRTGDRPEQALQARAVFAVIAGLPERYRLALVAVDVAGLSYREAATLLETKEATIATRIFRAREQVALRLALEEDPPPAALPETEPTSTENPPPAAAAETEPTLRESPPPAAPPETERTSTENPPPAAAAETEPTLTENPPPAAPPETEPTSTESHLPAAPVASGTQFRLEQEPAPPAPTETPTASRVPDRRARRGKVDRPDGVLINEVTDESRA